MPEGKTRITNRLDQDIVDRFFRMAEESGGGTGYQTLINAALREYLDGKSPRFEDTLRRIIREELKSSAGLSHVGRLSWFAFAFMLFAS